MTGRVEVLLATCNSADYLAELLDSLAAQTHDDFHLVVSDDLSTDGTLGLVEAAAPRLRHPVEIIRRDTPSGSASANFSSLMARSTGDYVFLADHDDIWLPEKIARGLAQMQAAEAEAGPGMPVMGHCNLSVANARGEVTAPSYWAFKSIVPEAGQQLNSALVAPTVTGCALYANRALLERALPVPEAAVMHDWWLNLVAICFGRVIFDPEPLILYRVHGRNASRPKQVSVKAAFRQRRSRAGRFRHNLARRIAQGTALRDRYADALPAEMRRTLDRFAAIPGQNALARRVTLLRGRFFWPGLWRNLVSLGFI